jgi:hypothetical protein
MAPVPAPDDLARVDVAVDEPTLPLRFDPPPAGPATIIPFPVRRRGAFIAKAIATGARYASKGRANQLLYVIDRHHSRLTRIGVAQELADADTLALAKALGMTRWGQFPIGDEPTV